MFHIPAHKNFAAPAGQVAFAGNQVFLGDLASDDVKYLRQRASALYSLAAAQGVAGNDDAAFNLVADAQELEDRAYQIESSYND